MNANASDVERRSGRPYMFSFHGMWSLGGFAGAGAGTLLLRVFSPAIETLIISAAISVLFLWGQQGLQQQKPAVPAPEKTRRALAKPAFWAL